MAYNNIKENREEEKKFRQKERKRVNQTYTLYFCLVRHVLIIKKRMRTERR